MLKKNIIRFGLITILLAVSLLFLHSSARVHEGTTCCKESMDKCPQKGNNPAPGGMIWETLSRQFFSFSPSSY
jgi:hypothetical protein